MNLNLKQSQPKDDMREDLLPKFTIKAEQKISKGTEVSKSSFN